MKIAVLGGTFDPIHYGHLRMAEVAAQELSCPIVLSPCGFPYHKENARLTHAGYRWHMCEEAVKGNDHLTVGKWEMNQAERWLKPTYTINYVNHLIDNGVTDLNLIIGYDEILRFDTWKDYQEILEKTKIVVIPRKGYTVSQSLLNNSYPEGDFKILDDVGMDISSTQIRELAKNQKTLKYLVPPRVEDFIVRNYLYREMA